MTRPHPNVEHSSGRATPRVAILTDSGSMYAPIAILELAESGAVEIAAIWRRSSLGGSGLKRVIERSGLRYALGRTIGLLKLAVFDWYRRRIKRDVLRARPRPTLDEVAESLGIGLQTLHSANTDEFHRAVADLDIDCLVLIFYGEILRGSTLELADGCILNSHPSPLPAYAGTNPVFWVLANSEKQTGVTVHLIDAGIDTGQIVAQELFDVTDDESHHDLYRRIVPAIGRLLALAIRERWTVGTWPTVDSHHRERSYFSSPTPDAYRAFRAAGRRFL